MKKLKRSLDKLSLLDLNCGSLRLGFLDMFGAIDLSSLPESYHTVTQTRWSFTLSSVSQLKTQTWKSMTLTLEWSCVSQIGTQTRSFTLTLQWVVYRAHTHTHTYTHTHTWWSFTLTLQFKLCSRCSGFRFRSCLCRCTESATIQLPVSTRGTLGTADCEMNRGTGRGEGDDGGLDR